MRILFIAQYFPPEVGALAARASELAHHWSKDGHQITILTGFPNYPAGEIHPEYRDKARRFVYRETFEGYNVVRTWLFTAHYSRSINRIINYLSFVLSAALTGSFLPRPDVVIASSPPLLVGLIGKWLGFVKRVPFVFEVRDLWPETLTGSGVGNQKGWFIRALKIVSHYLYRASDHIVVVTPAFKRELIEKKGTPPEKVSIVMNGVNVGYFSPAEPNRKLLNQLGLIGKFVVSYIGTFGLTQGMDTVIEAAELVENQHDDIHFLLIGEGTEKDRLEALVRDKNLSNVKFLPLQPKVKIPSLLNLSDVCLVPLRKSDVFTTVIPTKMLEYMACGKPVILGVEGQARRILEDARGGSAVEPENPQSYVDAIIIMYQDKGIRELYGQNGRDYIMRNLSREGTAQEYIKTLIAL